MTEITKNTNALAPAVKRFVLHWGDMGNQWGVNRSVAQIHALLFLSERPLPAEDIAESLGIARSNVSNSLKELVVWKLIRRMPVDGDRRDHFEAVGDIWEMVTRIVAVRKARELDPALEVLKSCLEEAKSDPSVPATAQKRLHEMHDFVESLNGWYTQIARLPRSSVEPLIKLGSKAVDLLTPFLKKTGK